MKKNETFSQSSNDDDMMMMIRIGLLQKTTLLGRARIFKEGA